MPKEKLTTGFCLVVILVLLIFLGANPVFTPILCLVAFVCGDIRIKKTKEEKTYTVALTYKLEEWVQPTFKEYFIGSFQVKKD